MTANALQDIAKIEASLWAGADQLRANSKLTSYEYCMPVLGVIFLRHATNRYQAALAALAAIQADQATGKMPKRPLGKSDFIKRRALMLPEAARYDTLLRLPSETNLGSALVDAMNAIETDFEPLAGQHLCSEIRESVSPEGVDPHTPYIGLEHMPRRSISLNEWADVAQVTSNKSRFKAGEILFGKIRPYFHKVGVAFVDGVASSDTIVIRPISEELHGLVLMTVSSDAFIAVTAQQMKEGSKMPRADWKQMQTYPVPVPPLGLLQTFEGLIQPVVAQLKTLSFSNQKLRTARDLLLPRLMNGEPVV